jgi:tetratricopeptide (TPR) repeat protein
VNLQLGNVPAAREAYQKGLDIRLKPAQADPTDAEAHRDLSISYEKLGDVNRQLGNVPAAREAYQKDLDISLKLAQADPTNARPNAICRPPTRSWET